MISFEAKRNRRVVSDEVRLKNVRIKDGDGTVTEFLRTVEALRSE